MQVKVAVALIVMLVVGLVAGTAYGEQKVKKYNGYLSPDIVLNGKKLEFEASQMPPIIMNDRTLLPIRAIAEALGLRVGFDRNSMEVRVDGSCIPPSR